MSRDVRGDAYIDSRDVIARLQELESERDSAKDEEIEDDDGEPRKKWTTQDGTEFFEDADWDEDREEEYQALKELDDDAPGEDWRNGSQMVRDDKFEEYAEQLADDIGLTEKADQWPFTHIDWEAAAEELKSDYTSVEFGGYEYWVR